MQIDQGPGPVKAYCWKGLRTRAKYGTSVVCCVRKLRSGRFFAQRSRNRIARSRYFCSALRIRRFGSMEGSFRVAPPGHSRVSENMPTLVR
jgi:hypothetical protein